MKNIVFIFLIASNIVNSQEYITKLSSDICDCFDENKEEVKKEFDKDLLVNCFGIAIKKNEKEMYVYYTKDKDTTELSSNGYQKGYEFGYEIGRKLIGDLQESLVDECDSYYIYSSKLISEMNKNLIKDANPKQLDSLSEQIDKNPENVDLIWERGVHKIAAKDIESAQLDFKLSLEKNSDHIPSLFFLAWSYNLSGDLGMSIESFENLLKKDLELGVIGEMSKMYLAILKRRKRESD